MHPLHILNIKKTNKRSEESAKSTFANCSVHHRTSSKFYRSRGFSSQDWPSSPEIANLRNYTNINNIKTTATRINV